MAINTSSFPEIDIILDLPKTSYSIINPASQQIPATSPNLTRPRSCNVNKGTKNPRFDKNVLNIKHSINNKSASLD